MPRGQNTLGRLYLIFLSKRLIYRDGILCPVQITNTENSLWEVDCKKKNRPHFPRSTVPVPVQSIITGKRLTVHENGLQVLGVGTVQFAGTEPWFRSIYGHSLIAGSLAS